MKIPIRVKNLRSKIKARTAELGIVTDHDEKGHWYKSGGHRYPSVTRKLALIKDEGLMNWKMNTALGHIGQVLKILKASEWDEGKIIALIKDAKLAHQLEFEGAGDIGKAVHDWREEWFSQWIEWASKVSDLKNYEISLPDDERPQVKASCEAIRRCIWDLKAQPLACELALTDDKLELGGMLDDIWAVPIDTKVKASLVSGDPLSGGYKLKRKWEVWFLDLKTSNIGNKNSYYMQVATYWAMFRKLYKIKIDKVFILHTSKTRFGEYELIPVKHPAEYFKMAKTTYKLYDDLQRLKELKKPEIAKI